VVGGVVVVGTVVAVVVPHIGNACYGKAMKKINASLIFDRHTTAPINDDDELMDSKARLTRKLSDIRKDPLDK